MIEHKVQQLVDYINQFSHISIAVSGGVDSMVLAYVANHYATGQVYTLHATSPAVPAAALVRVKQFAKRYQWQLNIIDAKEFNDPNYLTNPVNRCYHCKSNLYSRISDFNQQQQEPTVIFSGTNIDDLGDVRPGLQAATELEVKHPYVETGINKQTIYQFAKFYSLPELQSLPAQPCLASRVETGIPIEAIDLDFINLIEEQTRIHLPEVKNVRCRITQQGTYLEIDRFPESKTLLDLSNYLEQQCAQTGRIFAGIRNYQKGSAFLNGISHG